MILEEVLIFSFLAFIIPFAWTPGPVNITLAVLGTTNGFKKSFPLIAGLNVAFTIQAITIGFGLSQIFILFPWLYQIIKYLGVSYILYLAWKILNMKLGSKGEIPLNFYMGLTLSFLNPKVYMTLIIVFSQFKSESVEDIILLSLLSMSMFLIGNSIWAIFGSSLRRFIQNEFIFKLQKQFFAFLLFGVALFMAFN